MLDEKAIVEFYESGLDIRKVAEKFSSSYEKIRQILKKNKVQWRRNYVSNLSPDQIEKACQMYDEGKTQEAIGKWFELSPPAIHKMLLASGRKPVDPKRKYDILRSYPISSKQIQFIVGTLLGDGCLSRDNNRRNFKLQIGQCKQQEEYFHWKRMMLDPFTNTWRENPDKRKNSIMLQATTITHPGLNKLGILFYPENGKKIVPDLDIWMTPLALATWIMDDGNLNGGVNMRICSQGFTESDNYKLRDMLKRVFDLNSKVMEFKMKNKLYYQITLNKKNTQKLSDIIRPYILPSMEYKIMSKSSETKCQAPEMDEVIVRPSTELEESV